VVSTSRQKDLRGASKPLKNNCRIERWTIFAFVMSESFYSYKKPTMQNSIFLVLSGINEFESLTRKLKKACRS